MSTRTLNKASRSLGVLALLVAPTTMACTETPPPKGAETQTVDCYAKPKFASPGVIAYRKRPSDCENMASTFEVRVTPSKDDKDELVLQVMDHPQNPEAFDLSDPRSAEMIERGAPVAGAPLVVVDVASHTTIFSGTTDAHGRTTVSITALIENIPDNVPKDRRTQPDRAVSTIITMAIDGTKPRNIGEAVQQIEPRLREALARKLEDEEWATLNPQRCLADYSEANCDLLSKFAAKHPKNPTVRLFLDKLREIPKPRDVAAQGSESANNATQRDSQPPDGTKAAVGQRPASSDRNGAAPTTALMRINPAENGPARSTCRQFPTFARDVHGTWRWTTNATSPDRSLVRAVQEIGLRAINLSDARYEFRITLHTHELGLVTFDFEANLQRREPGFGCSDQQTDDQFFVTANGIRSVTAEKVAATTADFFMVATPVLLRGVPVSLSAMSVRVRVNERGSNFFPYIWDSTVWTRAAGK